MMFNDILAKLPVDVAASLTAKLENCTVAIDISEDEAREIIGEIVHQLQAETLAYNDEVKREINQLLEQVTSAVISVIFG